jgi:hypothetical protein
MHTDTFKIKVQQCTPYSQLPPLLTYRRFRTSRHTFAQTVQVWTACDDRLVSSDSPPAPASTLKFRAPPAGHNIRTRDDEDHYRHLKFKEKEEQRQQTMLLIDQC